jgi:hypothetical protein
MQNVNVSFIDPWPDLVPYSIATYTSDRIPVCEKIRLDRAVESASNHSRELSCTARTAATFHLGEENHSIEIGRGIA